MDGKRYQSHEDVKKKRNDTLGNCKGIGENATSNRPCKQKNKGWKYRMNEMCKNIFKRYIKCYMAIQTLAENSIFDEEEKAVHEHNLLNSIMVTMQEEIEE